MNKSSFLASALLAGGLLLGAANVQAQERSVTLTTNKAVGTALTLLVNATYDGVTVDWGDGKPENYKESKDGLTEITGTVKGAAIKLSGTRAWTLLSAADCGITSVDLTKARDLESLYLQNNALETIDLTDMQKLRDFNAANNALTSIGYTNTSFPERDLKLIESFNVSNNKLTGTFVIRTQGLRNLDISGNNISVIYTTSNPSLDYLDVSGNQIKTLNLSKCTDLTTLLCSNNGLTSITWPSSSTSLQQVIMDGNSVSADLDLSGNTSMTDLSVADNGIAEIIMPAKTQLSSLNLSGNKLGFGALPIKAYKPQYLAFMPQAPIDVSAYTNMKEKDGVPYMPVVSWNDRTVSANQLDLSALRNIAATSTSAGTVEGTTRLFSVEANGDTLELAAGKSSAEPNDYYVISGRYAFLKPHGRVFARIEAYRAYKDEGLYVQTTDFAVGEDQLTGIGHISTTDGLSIASARGTLTLSAPAATGVSVISADGRTIWRGVVNGSETLSLPAGVYIVNGQKVAL